MYYKDLLRHRTAWLGIATLWVLLFHLPIKIRALWYLQTFGYGGVDICLFASGAGCFYSLCGNTDVGAFLKRRVKRIAPACILAIGVWLVFRFALGQIDLPMAVGNLLGLQSFTGRGMAFNWYISAIFLFYLLAPYLKLGAERLSPIGKVILLLFLLVCTIPFWQNSNNMILMTRLPIFYAGMLLGDLSKREVRIKPSHWISMVVAFILGVLALLVCYKKLTDYLWGYGLFWYPFLLIVPLLCAGISVLMTVLERRKFTRPLLPFLNLVGDYSLELYLMQVLWVLMTPTFINKFHLQPYTNWVWIAGVAAMIPGSYVLRKCAKGLGQIFQPSRKAPV